MGVCCLEETSRADEVLQKVAWRTQSTSPLIQPRHDQAGQKRRRERSWTSSPSVAHKGNGHSRLRSSRGLGILDPTSCTALQYSSFCANSVVLQYARATVSAIRAGGMSAPVRLPRAMLKVSEHRRRQTRLGGYPTLALGGRRGCRSLKSATRAQSHSDTHCRSDHPANTLCHTRRNTMLTRCQRFMSNADRSRHSC